MDVSDGTLDDEIRLIDWYRLAGLSEDLSSSASEGAWSNVQAATSSSAAWFTTRSKSISSEAVHWLAGCERLLADDAEAELEVRVLHCCSSAATAAAAVVTVGSLLPYRGSHRRCVFCERPYREEREREREVWMRARWQLNEARCVSGAAHKYIPSDEVKNSDRNEQTKEPEATVLDLVAPSLID